MAVSVAPAGLASQRPWTAFSALDVDQATPARRRLATNAERQAEWLLINDLISKHGIRMTGMPAWGKTHNDDELWSIVALITRFPNFGDDEYSDLLQTAREEGVEHVHDHEAHEQEDDHEHGGHHH